MNEERREISQFDSERSAKENGQQASEWPVDGTGKWSSNETDEKEESQKYLENFFLIIVTSTLTSLEIKNAR